MKDIPLLVIFREELSIFLIAQVDIGFSSCSTGICSLGGTQWCVSLCWGNNFLGEKIQLQERTMELGIFLTEFTLGYLPVHMKTNLMIFLLSKGLAKDANLTTEKCPLFWVVPPRGRGFKKSTTSYCPISKPKESAEGEATSHKPPHHPLARTMLFSVVSISGRWLQRGSKPTLLTEPLWQIAFGFPVMNWGAG